MLKVVVDRKRWLRGLGAGESGLLRNNGQMCCLGFVCKALGVPEELMLNVPTPLGVLTNNSKGAVPKKVRRALEPFRRNKERLDGMHTELIASMMRINDVPSDDPEDPESLSDESREVRLIELAEQAGIELSFED